MDIGDATRKSGVVWVTLDGQPPRVVWHVWHQDALWLVCGGLEQALPGADGATTATVVVRNSQNDRAATWTATVEPVLPGSPAWEVGVPGLHAARLNAPDGEDQPARWARESLVLTMTPVDRPARLG